MSLEVRVPITLPSIANARLHWAAKAKLFKKQRDATTMYLSLTAHGFRDAHRLWGENRTVHVMLTRVSPRKLDGDNLQSAFKGVRDSVAAFFLLDDGDESRIVFGYGQRKGPPEVLIELSVVPRLGETTT